MGNTKFPESRILSVSQFIHSFQTGCDNRERFCFILGSGASVDSGIPMGGELENEWMRYLMGEESESGKKSTVDPMDTRSLAEKLKKEGKLQYNFQEIEEAWERIKEKGEGTLSSAYYFDLYKLRFHPNHRNGYRYLEKLMAGKSPSIGYHPLARLLTDGSGNNLVITTNFDSLMEDALFLYTDSKPLVINHELLANYIGDNNVQRPIIAKVHRGMFFDPLNDPDETSALKKEWNDVLQRALYIYTPVVLGYGGGDHSLMDFLKKDSTKMINGIYWCYVERYGLPSPEIQEFVEKNGGCFVKIHGFDHIMLQMGMSLFPDAIGSRETEAFLTQRNAARIQEYYERVDELLNQLARAKGKAENHTTEKEFSGTIQEFHEKEAKKAEEREQTKTMTAWDYFREAEQLRKQNRLEEAAESYTKAIALNQKYVDAYYMRGRVYQVQKEYEKALLDYGKVLELDGKHENAHYRRGIIYHIQKNYERALEEYERVIAINEKNTEAYYRKGIVYYAQEEYEKALAAYTQAIELGKKGDVYRKRGCVYYAMGNYDKALEDYDKALQLNPEWEANYYNRACVYYRKKDYEKARTDFGKTIELNESYTDAYHGRGNVYYVQKEYEKALLDYEKAIELKSKHGSVYQQRGRIYNIQGEYVKALEDYNQAITLCPKGIDLYKERAKILHILGRKEEAEADEKKAEELTALPGL